MIMRDGSRAKGPGAAREALRAFLGAVLCGALLVEGVAAADTDAAAACSRADALLVGTVDAPPERARAIVQSMKTVLAELQCPSAPRSCARVLRAVTEEAAGGAGNERLRAAVGLYRELPCDVARLVAVLGAVCAETVRRFDGLVRGGKPWFEAVAALGELQAFHCPLGPLLDASEKLVKEYVR